MHEIFKDGVNCAKQRKEITTQAKWENKRQSDDFHAVIKYIIYNSYKQRGQKKYNNNEKSPK